MRRTSDMSVQGLSVVTCGETHSSSGILPYSSVKGGESTVDTPLGCCGSGLSTENGLELGSANRGEPFSVRDWDAGLDGNWNGRGFRLAVLGDDTGMLET